MARSTIPDGITREDISRALADLDAGTVQHGFHESDRYDLVHEGRRYAPKAVLGVAARRVAGHPLVPGDFTGGEGSPFFRILRSHGFTVELKPGAPATRSATTYHAFNIGKPYTDAWWARNVSMGVITAGIDNTRGDRGDAILHDISTGDWVLAYATGAGFIGAGIAGAPESNRILPPAELPSGYESPTHRQFRDVKWLHWIPQVNDAVSRAEAGFHPVATKARILDHAIAENIILLIAARGQTATTNTFPDEVPPGVSYAEGAVKQVLVDRYERNPEARRACIAHWGFRCTVCSFDFGEKFGALGEGFIHVHHLRPISTSKEQHDVDPVADLRPVCPNCHAMLHRTQPPMTIEALQQHLKSVAPTPSAG